MNNVEKNDIDEIAKGIENSVGELYRGFYRLRKMKEYQTEYDSMGAIINMLMQDRQHLREKYNVKVL